MADEVGAMNFAFAIVSALLARERTGVGQLLETSQLGAMIGFMGNGNSLARTLRNGREKDDGKPAFIENAYRQTYYIDKNKRWFVIALVQEKDWVGLCRALGPPGQRLRGAAAYASFELRQKNTAQLKEALQEVFVTESRDVWLDALAEAGVVCAPVNSLTEVAEEEHNWENGYLTEVQHPEWGKVRVLGSAVQFHGTPAPPPSFAPRLGEHTAEVLRELGLDADKVTASGMTPPKPRL
jgi:formyl-CoA transferase/CoA:oxalate CoA-transferase